MTVHAPSSSCPCTSGKTYDDCCLPLHAHDSFATTAEQLMRSRYSAWALELIDYLIQTTSPEQQQGLVRSEMEEWAQQAQWQSLEIVDTRGGLVEDSFGEVEFKARFKLPGDKQIHEHHERSHFARKDGRWFFVDPNIPAISTKLAGRNDPCPCGSGKKYKKCCG